MPDKPRVLVTPLCGVERQNWISPGLMMSLFDLKKDARFDAYVQPVYEQKPYERARNLAMVAARDQRFDVLVQVDNDVTLPYNFADIVHGAIETEKQVVCLKYAGLFDDGPSLIPTDNGPRDGEFQQTGCAGGGCMIILSSVWKAIPKGPWFRWIVNDDETSTRKISEDYYFCELLSKRGIKVWTHTSKAGHLRTVDITRHAPAQQDTGTHFLGFPNIT